MKLALQLPIALLQCLFFNDKGGFKP
jgi:hypothetical protein